MMPAARHLEMYVDSAAVTAVCILAFILIVGFMGVWYGLACICCELRQHRKVAERLTGGYQPVASRNAPKPPQGGSVAKPPQGGSGTAPPMTLPGEK